MTLSDRASHGGEELAALLDEILPRASEDAARVAILRALGRAQERLGHRAEAVDAWRRVLETVPSDSEAMGCLVQLYQAAGRAPELLEIYKRQLAISEDAAVRAALLFQVAGLQDGALHDTVGAMATLRRLLELKPDDAPGPGAAGRALREAAALAGAGGRHRTAAGARPAGTSTSTSAPGWRWSARRGSSTSTGPWTCTGRC